MLLRTLLALIALGAAGLRAQSVDVYSEFQRVDPFGQIVAIDRAETPREILSPALARNAFATFQVVVNVPPGVAYNLFIAQNPANAVRVAAYQPIYVKRGENWFPDGLKLLDPRADGLLPDIPFQVPGQTVRSVWLDLFVDAKAPIARTRLEVQLALNGGERWIIYPMELRIRPVVAPAPSVGRYEPLAPIEASAADSAAAPWRVWGCGQPPGDAPEGDLTVRRLIRRNARQDIAIARTVAHDAASLFECSAAPPAALGAEWYLRLRAAVLRRFEPVD